MNKLIQQYEHLQISFLTFYAKTAKSQGKEDIHQLRVSIKKLRAHLSLIEEASHGLFKKKQHFTLFSPLFKAAGKVREIQVNLMLIQKMDSKHPASYIEYLTVVEHLAKKELIKELVLFDLKKLESLNNEMFAIASKITTEEIQEVTTKLISSNLDKTNKLKTNIHKDRKLHKIRIYLKEAGALIDFLPEEKIASKTKKDRRTQQKDLKDSTLKKIVKKINEQIGDWHDYSVLSDSIAYFLFVINKHKPFHSILKQLDKKSKLHKKNIGELLNLLPNRI